MLKLVSLYHPPDSDGNLVVVEIHQVGKTLVEGTTPVIRERRAIADIENNSGGVKVDYLIRTIRKKE